jgi:hypothetical protein
MSEAKHTPGPWEWVAHGEYGYSALTNSVNSEVLATGGFNDGDYPVTWMGEEMSDADARLIAAAPELLEALVELSVIVESLLEVVPRITDIDSFTTQPARAAIAKATGKT